ncbi:MAG: hypothetical protein D4R56_06240 [Deltaproteobacteria bacterium]|nr:MAG: hypothetical protein D4R56_06240 [Deltaproteobacteria bacterium]
MVSAIERQILQSQVMERIQQVQQQHPDMQQQYFKIQFDQERRKLKKKVYESGQINHVTVGEEEGKKQQKDHPRDEEAVEQIVDGKASNEQKQHDHIDIQV